MGRVKDSKTIIDSSTVERDKEMALNGQRELRNYKMGLYIYPVLFKMIC